MSVKELTKENFSQEVNVNEIVLIDFWASWCGPCRMLSPIIDEIAEENPGIKVCKVNIDDEIDIAREFEVFSIPTVIVFKDGQETNRSTGVKPKKAILDLLGY